MKSFSQRIPFLHFGPIALVVCCGFLTTLLLVLFVQHLEQQTLKAYFVQLAEDDIFAMHTALDWYLEPLEAVAAFYNASVAINRHEYATFVKPFLEQRPYIEAIQWIPRIPDDQRIVYETTVRNETAAGYDFSQFTFTEYHRTADGKQHLAPARIRTEYYPIYYQEPLRQRGQAQSTSFYHSGLLSDLCRWWSGQYTAGARQLIDRLCGHCTAGARCAR